MASTPRSGPSPAASLRIPHGSTGSDRSAKSSSSSLDRANTTPHDTWEEGDQTLREYRLRKAAREEARRRNRASSAISEGGFWDSSDSSSSLAGSHRLPVKPPSPSASSPSLSLSASGAATPTPALVRPPSMRSRSSTHSVVSRTSASDIVVAPNFLRTASNSSVPLPSLSGIPTIPDTLSSTGSIKSLAKSQVSLPRSSSSSSVSSQARSTRSSAPPRMFLVEDIQNSAITLREHDGVGENETESLAAPSIIIHSEASSTNGNLSEFEASHEMESAALEAELRKRRITARDDSDHGIPKTVIIGGKAVDIREMDILEQVEMMRMADRERQEMRAAAAIAAASGGGKDSVQGELEDMKYTELSDIAEGTECPTYSQRSSIAPTMSEAASRRSYAPSRYAPSLAAPSVRSNLSTMSSDVFGSDGAPLSQAERIKQKYYKQEGPSSANPVDRQSASGHRKYSSVGDTVYHTSSPVASSRASARSARSAVSEAVSYTSSRSGMSPTKAPRGRGVHPLSSANVLEDRSGSPTKRALSPVVASRMAQFDLAPSLSASASASMMSSPAAAQAAIPFGQTAYKSPAPSVPRLRTKSLSHDGLSDYALSAKSFQASSYPAFSGLPLPASKSTGDLVKLYEQKSTETAQSPVVTVSPVKEWLQRVASPDTASETSSRRSQQVRSDAPSPASLRTPVNETGLLTPLFSEPGQNSATSRLDFYDAQVVHHGEIYWLNSSSKTQPPFWQLCRAVLNKRDEIVVSWPGASTGEPHTRRFDLKTCSSAGSVRRNPSVQISTVSDDADSIAASKAEVEKLQIFELVWPGRTQRFATPNLPTRMKWLGCIFTVLSRYSHTGETSGSSVSGSEQASTIGSATLRSMDLALPTPGSEVDPAEHSPKRYLEKDTQDSLYASVSQMLSPGTGTKTLEEQEDTVAVATDRNQADLPDIPRYQLRDPPLSPTMSVREPSAPLLPSKTRGAWSETDRQSTRSAGLVMDAPPARNVARDMKRLLTMMERQGSVRMSRSTEFPEHMESMKMQLESISKQLRQSSVKSRHSVENSRMADKVDEMMHLLHRLACEKEQNAALAEKAAAPAIPETAVVDQRAADLQRIEGMIGTLLAKLETSSASVTANNSPETNRVALALPVLPVRQSIMPETNQQARRPSANSITTSMGADIDLDAIEWAKNANDNDNKRNGVLPALPRSTSVSPEKAAGYRALQAQKSNASLGASTEISSGRRRFERQNTAMRLEGSHLHLVGDMDDSRVRNASASNRNLGSAWSADTPMATQTSSRMPSAIHKPTMNTSKRPPIVERAGSVNSKVSSDDSPPTPKARDFQKNIDRGPDPHQQSMLIQMNSMQELLATLVASQAKHDESLKHQQQVSEYIQHLHEYLSNDREMRKEEFKIIKDSLHTMQDQIAKLPQEIQTLVQASIAIAGVQNAHAPPLARVPSAGPPPTNDAPGPDSDGPPAQQPRQNSKPPPSGSQGKAQGTSLLRKVSLGLAGGGPGNSAIRVGGPRKLGGPRLFGHPPASNSEEARNRWATDKSGKGSDAPPFAGATGQADVHASAGGDNQAPLMQALQGFEEQLAAADEAGEDGNDQASVIAMGIMEILKMMKAQQAKDEMRDQQKVHRQAQKEYTSADRHARELDSIRMEIRDWEAKRAELEMANRDPQNQEGIDTIIALLKDQMAAQEKLLVDMKESVTPKLANLDEDAKLAMHDMKEHMLDNLDTFRSKMDSEVKKTLEEVSTLREQKKQLQSDLADLLAFKSKYGGGAPENVPQPRMGGRTPGPSYPAPTSDGGGPFPRSMRGPR